MRFLIVLFLMIKNLLAGTLVASDIDPSPASSDMGIIFFVVLAVLLLLFSYKKILNLIGR